MDRQAAAPPISPPLAETRGGSGPPRSYLAICIQLYTILSMVYTVTMSETFRRWMRALRDRQAQARIAVRIDRVQEGNFGDHRSVGQGVSELRINVAQGYRVYYTIRDTTLVLLLCGGDKASQQQDIQRAQHMARTL